MNRLKRGAIVLSLVEALRRHGSWCGETNIQKAAYFLKYVVNIPLDYPFVLYKYGPYSFELTEDLTALRADSVLDLAIRDRRYGPSFSPGLMADFVRSSFPKTIAAHSEKIEFIAEKLGGKDIANLERLATALYVRRQNQSGNVYEWANCIHELKPHIAVKEAMAAIHEVEVIIGEADQMKSD